MVLPFRGNVYVWFWSLQCWTSEVFSNWIVLEPGESPAHQEPNWKNYMQLRKPYTLPDQFFVSYRFGLGRFECNFVVSIESSFYILLVVQLLVLNVPTITTKIKLPRIFMINKFMFILYCSKRSIYPRAKFNFYLRSTLKYCDPLKWNILIL